MSHNKLRTLLNALSYQFQQPQLLEQALTHRSMGGQNNERLEFLGDAVLGLAIAEILYERFAEASEGQLSRLRANLVNKESLAAIARTLKLGDYLHLGQGELRSGGQQRQSILADALEAIIGAIYLDGGFSAAKQCITLFYAAKLSHLALEDLHKDAKTRLQEYLQAQKLPLPEYSIVLIEGQEHAQQFHVRCQVPGEELISEGVGSTRRKAEQKAAAHYLEKCRDAN